MVEGGDGTVQSRRRVWAESQTEVSAGEGKMVDADLRSLPSQSPTRSYLLTLEGIQSHQAT